MSLRLIAIETGNTRTRLGRFDGRTLEETIAIPNDRVDEITSVAARWWGDMLPGEDRAIVASSVNDRVADEIQRRLESSLSIGVYRIGDDLPVPIGEDLDPETLTGQDRLLAAAAAWDVLKQACVVIDAGTAVTVDFVDGQGTFHGGAIAPGARMQLKALHEHTAALPAIEFDRPDPESPFGRNTRQAMLHGVYDGIRGLAWRLVERYAEKYGAFPLVVATGGDADLLFGEDELVNRIVPDLTLQGIAAAARLALSDEDEPGDEPGHPASGDARA